MIPTTPPPLPQNDTAPVEIASIEFHGEWKEYFRIWIVNTLLTIATLGIYAAWAKVRTRRYFHANTRLFGHSFEYLANPRRILVGNLIVAALFIAYSTSQLISPLLFLLTLGVFVFLVPWFIVRGAAFNARNTAWRGLRFNFNGTYANAFSIFILGPLFFYITLGFGFPIWEKWRREFFANNHAYGKTPFRLNIDSGAFYRYFFVMLGISLLCILVFTAVLVALSALSVALESEGDDKGVIMLLPVFGTLFFYFLLFTVTGSYWKARVFSHVWSGTRIGPLVFHAKMRARDLFRLQLENIGLLLCSLGLLWPLVKIRTTRFQLERVRVERQGDLDSFVAAAQPELGALGDAASDFWDFDIGFGI